jgi:hypothetical protein
MVHVRDTSAAVIISNTTISHSQNWGVYVYSGTAPSLTDSTITDNGLGGLFSDVVFSTLSSNSFYSNSGPAVKIPAGIGANVVGNTYSGNQINGMFLSGHIPASSNITWPVSNSPYIIEALSASPNFLQVPSSSTLAIGSGAVVKIKAEVSGGTHTNKERGIYVSGRLDATSVIVTS